MKRCIRCCCVQCCCTPKPKEKPIKIIHKKEKDCGILKEEVEVIQSKKDCCPDNNVTSIFGKGDKVVIVFDDCTYLEVDASILDKKSLKDDSEFPTDYISNVEIDGNQLIFYRKDGSSYSFTKEELLQFLDAGVVRGEIVVNKEQVSTATTLEYFYDEENKFSSTLLSWDTNPRDIKLVLNKNGITEPVEINLNNLQDVFITSGRLNNKKAGEETAFEILLNVNDGKNIPIPLTDLQNWVLEKLKGFTPNTANVNVSTINRGNVTNDNGWKLNLIKTDDSKIEIDLQEFFNSLKRDIYQTGYRLNTVDEDYVLSGEDFNGFTVIRANKDGIQNITVPKPTTESFIGKSITVRKTNGALGTYINLVAGDGVRFIPEDATPIRRIGSTVSLVYVGNGIYDVYGELP